MASQTILSLTTRAGNIPGSNPSLGTLRYLARQPILDRQGNAHGYELLFRTGPDAEYHGSAESATRIMIDNAIVYGLRKLTGGAPAFVNCTPDALIQKLVWILPPGMAVLELPGDVELTADLLAACKALKAAEYKLAIDNFVYRPALKPLIQLADFIKVDFHNASAQDRVRSIAAVREMHKTLIAEKVETQADYQRAVAEGFTLFQGYHFCRPLLLSKHPVPANKLAHLRLLAMLDQDELDFNKIGEQVKLDPALTYRLLRYVNSPLCPIREEVRSVQAALMIVGETLFRRFSRLAIMSEINSGQTGELLRTAFVRARFCELAAELLQFEPQEQYLMGLFSLLPAMVQAPMEEALAGLPLRSEARRALLGEFAPLHCLVDWIACYERADWQGANQVAAERGLAPEKLQECFAHAVLWADEMLWTSAASQPAGPRIGRLVI